MEFIKVIEEVKSHLSILSLQEKVLLLKNVCHAPLDYRDGAFYLNGKEYTEVRMSDYLKIKEHWMTVHEFDKIYLYLENTKKNE
jgi:hypothetical protein